MPGSLITATTHVNGTAENKTKCQTNFSLSMVAIERRWKSAPWHCHYRQTKVRRTDTDIDSKV